MNLSEEEKNKLRNRLRRIGGQVDAVARMVDQDAYCVDVLTQLSAATGALAKVGQLVLENHIKTCVSDAIREGEQADRDEKIKELIEVFRRYANVVD